MDIIKVGRNKKNDLVIEDPSVSNFHLEIEVQNFQSFLVKDVQSTNGTFVNEVRVAKCVLQPIDQLRLGNKNINVQSFFSEINKIVSREKTDFQEEYKSLMRLFEQYQGRKNSILNPPKLPMFLRLGLGILVIFILLIFPDLIPDNMRIALMMGVSIISVLPTMIGNSQVKKNEKLDLLKLEFEDRLVCPKCSVKMINQNMTYWKGKKECINTKCDAIFQE